MTKKERRIQQEKEQLAHEFFVWDFIPGPITKYMDPEEAIFLALLFRVKQDFSWDQENDCPNEEGWFPFYQDREYPGIPMDEDARIRLIRKFKKCGYLSVRKNQCPEQTFLRINEDVVLRMLLKERERTHAS